MSKVTVAQYEKVRISPSFFVFSLLLCCVEPPPHLTVPLPFRLSYNHLLLCRISANIPSIPRHSKLITHLPTSFLSSFFKTRIPCPQFSLSNKFSSIPPLSTPLHNHPMASFRGKRPRSGPSTDPSLNLALDPSNPSWHEMCFNCFQPSHTRTNCPSKGFVCSRCNKLGHDVRSCKKIVKDKMMFVPKDLVDNLQLKSFVEDKNFFRWEGRNLWWCSSYRTRTAFESYNTSSQL